jgi:glycosyltransferase involved in cell wall biosynthesis
MLVAHHANPELTSEPLIGWRWACALSRQAEVTLVTHVRNRRPIESAAGFEGSTAYVDTERLARGVNALNDRIFPDAGSVNRLLLETIAQLAFDREAVRIARGLVRRGEVDVIHRVSPISPRYPTGLAGLGVPLVVGPVNGGLSTASGFPEIERTERQRFLGLRRAARLLAPRGGALRRAGAVLIANETTRTVLPRGVRKQAEVMCENAVDLEAFTPRYERSGRVLRVLFLGRLLASKGVQYALDALAGLPPGCEVHLDVVGDGGHRVALEERCARLGLADQVTFHGLVPHAEVPVYLAAADVLLLPSVRESGGAVVLEAMAAGKPVVVADHGGPAETVTDRIGIRVPCCGAEALVDGIAGALRHLASNEARRERMGRAARHHVEEHHSWDARAERALRVYDRVITSREARRKKRREVLPCTGPWNHR